MPKRPVLYLFDIDGTILLSGGAGQIALNHVFEERYGIQGAMDGVVASGNTDPLILVEIFERRLYRRPEPEEIDDILRAYVPRLQAALQEVRRFRLMPAVIETLDYLAVQPGVHLGVATGNIRAAAQAKLERAGLWDRFFTGGFGDDSANRAELVQRAIDRARAHTGIDFAPEAIVVVGDTPRDISAARACGVRVVAVATGMFDVGSLEKHGADVVLETLEKLPAWHTEYL